MPDALTTDLLACEDERETLTSFLYMFPMGVGSLNARGDFELVNPELARLLQAVAPGCEMANFFDEIDRFAPELRVMARDFSGVKGAIFDGARVFTPGAGSGIEALSSTLIQVADDAFMLIVRDVTELVAQERELLRANHLLEMSQRLAHVGHFYREITTSRLVLSDEVYRIFGRKPEDGPPTLAEAWNSVHPDDRDAFAKLLARAEATGEGFERELRIVRPDGEIRDTRCGCEVQRDADGAIVATVAIYSDITAYKHAEREQIRHREAAEQASRAKSDFLATMSHELRTPMNGVIGMNALLLETEQTLEQRHLAETVQHSANALLGILDDVLDVAKLGAGRIELRETEFELAPLVENVVELMGAAARTKRLALAREITGVGDAALRGDPGRLRQILLNFVSNAVKFTEQGFVKVAVRGTPEDGNRLRLRFAVSDSGAGLRDDVKARIFRPFEQADSSISRRYGGAGLGLSISRGLAELMGGAVGVADRPGGGAIFWLEVTLPRVKTAVVAPVAALAPITGAGRVLVAEDNKVNADFVRLVLKKAGFDVRVVIDGVEAVEAARSESFDLILMDMQMPRMDGLDATRAIRALPGARVPIIALTANALPEDELRCLEAGADAYLAKPIPPVKLRAVAAKWMRIGEPA